MNMNVNMNTNMIMNEMTRIAKGGGGRDTFPLVTKKGECNM